MLFLVNLHNPHYWWDNRLLQLMMLISCASQAIGYKKWQLILMVKNSQNMQCCIFFLFFLLSIWATVLLCGGNMNKRNAHVYKAENCACSQHSCLKWYTMWYTKLTWYTILIKKNIYIATPRCVCTLVFRKYDTSKPKNKGRF